MPDPRTNGGDIRLQSWAASHHALVHAAGGVDGGELREQEVTYEAMAPVGGGQAAAASGPHTGPKSAAAAVPPGTGPRSEPAIAAAATSRCSRLAWLALAACGDWMRVRTEDW